MHRTARASTLLITLSSALALALPARAGAEDTEPAVVVNGTFAAPAVPDGRPWAYLAVEGWDGPGLASAGRAAHPRGYQAAFLAAPDSERPLATRLRAVRAGATVTLSWDDNPDTCAGRGVPRRTYTVSVAGSANPPGAFATNEPNGRANWFLGRTYSFTAAEDSPRVTFSFDAANPSPGCQPFISNVTAKQTAPPPGGADPCAGDAAGTSACTSLGTAQDQIAACPATGRDCLAGVAGDGKQTTDGIAGQSGAVQDFAGLPRDQDPASAAAGLCPLSSALTDGVPPENLVIPPSRWGAC
ncbi:hypothetical protein [Kitasatospora sp. NPDC088134]|uniref:hypothetical protein n=1 Tax=Kitasatospora sp. NPDC088134 TaxID=3364071 RepID=UPI003806F210